MNLHLSRSLAAIAFGCCLPVVLSGQPTGRADAEVRATFSAAATMTGKTTVENGGVERGEVSTNEYESNLGIPFATNYSFGLAYKLTEIDLPDNDTGVALPEHLRKVAATLTYTRRVDERWTGLLVLTPSWNTASGGQWSDGSGFGTMLVAGARWKYSPTLTYSFGVRYDSLARSSYRLLPAIGFEWRPGGPWTVAVGFPRTAVSYAVSPALRLAAVVEGAGSTYFVEKDPLPALVGKPSLAESKLEFTEIRTGLNATYSLSKATSIGATAGMVVSRTFDYHSAHYKLKGRDNAAYFSLSARIGF